VLRIRSAVSKKLRGAGSLISRVKDIYLIGLHLHNGANISIHVEVMPKRARRACKADPGA